MKSDHELFEGLTRALNHTLADYVRRHDNTSSKAVFAAAMGVLINVSQNIGAELGYVINALRDCWGSSLESADPSDAPSGSPPRRCPETR